MTTGPVEETPDAAAPVQGPPHAVTPHAAPPPVPPSPAGTTERGLRSRLAIIWAVAFGMLLLAFMATVIALNSTVYSASGFVSAYLQSLARHDIDAVLAMPGVEGDDDASEALLRRAVLTPLTELELVDDEDRGGGVHHVTYSYRVGGETGRTTFVVEHAGPHWGVFSSWAFDQSPLGVIEVIPRNTVEFEVNGVPVVAAGGAGATSRFQVLVPGAFTFSHQSEFLEVEETTVPVTATHRPEEVVLTASASREFVDAVETELGAYLDRCAEDEVLYPTGCPFGKEIVDLIVSTPEWEILDYPSVEVLPGDEVGVWVVPPAHGEATLTVDIMSRFDGSVSSFSEAVPFTVTYLITFTPDGGITLTPR